MHGWVGECKDGLANGLGKEFYEDGTQKYVGNFQNGKYHGQGSSYNKKGNLTYKGSFGNGLPNGEGSFYEDGELYYTGCVKNGKANGLGMQILDFNGSTSNLLKSSTAYDESSKYTYEGNFKDFRFDGNGVLKKDNKIVYEGECKDGLANGSGQLYNLSSNTLKFDGIFRSGKLYQGTWYDENGRKTYIGQFDTNSNMLRNGVARIDDIWFLVKRGEIQQVVQLQENPKIIDNYEM
ncbi:MAG: hypothetical protein EBV68_04135, partial [Betaproteobacteria bacterium]|nr:hypothetical protein [Betaproteobacteria bacterium]